MLVTQALSIAWHSALAMPALLAAPPAPPAATSAMQQGPQQFVIQIRAVVPEICFVERTTAVGGDQLRVEVACNAERFELRGSGFAGSSIVEASTGDPATVSTAGNRLAIVPQRPGRFAFRVRFDHAVAADAGTFEVASV